jgi:hypothetical protein
MHAVTIFMHIQKLWQVVGVSIAYTRILNDKFVSAKYTQKIEWLISRNHKSL